MSPKKQDQNRNYMNDLRCLLEKIVLTKPEPEICNVSCPPLGCPRGPCPGMCRDEYCYVDPCCISRMPPRCASPPKCQRGCSRKH